MESFDLLPSGSREWDKRGNFGPSPGTGDTLVFLLMVMCNSDRRKPGLLEIGGVFAIWGNILYF